MPRIRKLLRVCRAEHDPYLTQTKLAKLARIQRLRYWAIENAESNATPQEKIQIANALGIEVVSIAWPEVVPFEPEGGPKPGPKLNRPTGSSAKSDEQRTA